MTCANTTAFLFHSRGKTDISLKVQEGRIADISTAQPSSDGIRVRRFNDCVLMPGLIDVHVHLREPGFLYKEDIASGTAAAARGGFTTICAMPNLNPAPDCLEGLRPQLEAINQKSCIKVLPYGTITVARAGFELADLQALAHFVCAFSDDGSGVQSESKMLEAMQEVKRLNKLIVAHCEDESLLHGGVIHQGSYAAAHGYLGICSESEWLPIKRDLKLVEQTGCRYHICHISCKESVGLIREAKKRGLPVSCETAPHYLLLDENDMQEQGDFKMNPPLRAREDREALLEGICDGTIDMIATDHAPHSAEEKARGLNGSPFGIVGLETAFPLLYTELVRKGIIGMERLLELMHEAPKRIFGLSGGLAVGNAADFTVFDLNNEYIIDAKHFLSKGRSTPFAGRRVYGQCMLTVCDGRIAWSYEDKEED